jgi:hypothetical protein
LHFTEGIEYAFPAGASLGPGEFLVLASNEEWFNFQYGFPAFGVYDRQLDNKAEVLVLRDAFSRTVFSTAYTDEAPWPAVADGLGFSLVLNNPSQADNPHDAASWRSSLTTGGTPGSEDIAPVVINEVLADGESAGAAAIELYNPAGYEADVGGWWLSDDEANPYQFVLPAGALIPPGGYLVVDQASLSAAASPLTIRTGGGDLHLFSANKSGALNGYIRRLHYGATPPGVSIGRYVAANGDEHYPLQRAVTLGKANSEPAVGPVVISELLYRTAGALEFIELTNLSAEAVKLYDTEDPSLAWRLGGVLYQFPAGVEIPAQGKLVITAADPTSVCTAYAVREGVQVVGPAPLALADNGQYVALERPGRDADGQLMYFVVDEVAYGILPPWPRPGEGRTSLERLKLTGYGSDPLSWRRGVAENDVIQSAATTQGPVAALCGFDVLPYNGGGLEIRWATHYEQNVATFNLWRSADGVREHAEQVAAGIPAQGGPELGAAYTFTDTTALAGAAQSGSQVEGGDDSPPGAYTYWLQAVGPANETVDVGFTTPRAVIHQLHLPLVRR